MLRLSAASLDFVKFATRLRRADDENCGKKQSGKRAAKFFCESFTHRQTEE